MDRARDASMRRARCGQALTEVQTRLYPKIGGNKKCKFSFFSQKHPWSTSFNIFVVTCRVTNFLPKTGAIIFHGKKLNFFFFNSLFFGVASRPTLPQLVTEYSSVPKRS